MEGQYGITEQSRIHGEPQNQRDYPDELEKSANGISQAAGDDSGTTTTSQTSTRAGFSQRWGTEPRGGKE